MCLAQGSLMVWFLSLQETSYLAPVGEALSADCMWSSKSQEKQARSDKLLVRL